MAFCHDLSNTDGFLISHLVQWTIFSKLNLFWTCAKGHLANALLMIFQQMKCSSALAIHPFL